MGQLILTLIVQAQGARTGGHQARTGDGIPAGKQGNLMSLADEFLRQVRDNPFSAALILRGHTFEEGRDLGDLHTTFPYNKCGAMHRA
jgi:hypothetical protein